MINTPAQFRAGVYLSMKGNSVMKRIIALLAAVAAIVFGLNACTVSDTATTSAQCGFIVGDGDDGRDAKVHDVVYPNQKVDLAGANNDNEIFKPIPCNSRNWITNPEGSKDANGDAIGDYHVAMRGVTSDGTKVRVWLSMFWTPNQTESVMKNQFFPFCEKYDCFSSNEEKVNNSSAGWNDMLGENVPGAVDATVRAVMPSFDDTVWTKDANWNQIAEQISAGFGAEFSKATGFGDDLFCGSGDVSGWDNPDEPGKGKFECGAVRFRIDSIENADDNQQELSDQQSKKALQLQANKDRFELAQELYGGNTGAVLGNLDLIEACRKSSSTCVITIGESGAPTVVNQTPTP